MLPLIGKFQQIISLKEDFADIQGLLVNNALLLLLILLLILRYHWPLYHVEMCTDGAKQWWGSTAGHWTHPTVVPSYTHSHCHLYHNTLLAGKKRSLIKL